MCSAGCVRRHKIMSISTAVFESIQVEDGAKTVKDLDLVSDKLPIERAFRRPLVC